MVFASTPISFSKNDRGIRIVRNIDEHIAMLDNLVELIVFTPKGSFEGDPDFGFEYWNHEFSNVNHRDFNNEQTKSSISSVNEVTKKECLDSILNSLSSYAPQLKQAAVSMDLSAAEIERINKKVPSKYRVNIRVEGIIDDGIGTTNYKKDMIFYMEPTAKKYRI